MAGSGGSRRRPLWQRAGADSCLLLPPPPHPCGPVTAHVIVLLASLTAAAIPMSPPLKLSFASHGLRQCWTTRSSRSSRRPGGRGGHRCQCFCLLLLLGPPLLDPPSPIPAHLLVILFLGMAAAPVSPVGCLRLARRVACGSLLLPPPPHPCGSVSHVVAVPIIAAAAPHHLRGRWQMRRWHRPCSTPWRSQGGGAGNAARLLGPALSHPPGSVSSRGIIVDVVPLLLPARPPAACQWRYSHCLSCSQGSGDSRRVRSGSSSSQGRLWGVGCGALVRVCRTVHKASSRAAGSS